MGVCISGAQVQEELPSTFIKRVSVQQVLANWWYLELVMPCQPEAMSPFQ